MEHGTRPAGLSAIRLMVRRSIVLTAMIAGMLAAAPATASMTLEIEVSSDGVPLLVAGPIALPLISENGSMQLYSVANLPGLEDESEFVLSGTVTVNTDMYAGGLRMSPGLTISSVGNSDLEFHIRLKMTTAHSGGVYWNSAAFWRLENSGMVFSLPDTSMWTMSIDSIVVGALFDDPSGIGGAMDAVMTTDPINGQESPVESQMIIDLAFFITSGTEVDAGGIALLTPCLSCPGDIDCSGSVDVADLLAMLAAWGSSDPVFDLDPEGGDGQVAVGDLLALLAAWGSCP